MSWTPNSPIEAQDEDFSGSSIVLPPSNNYTCLITSYIIEESKSFDDDKKLLPQLTLEVVNIDRGFSVGGTVKNPKITEGDFDLYQQFLVRTVTLDRLYSEPKEGDELSKKQQLVQAITGGTTIEHYNSLFSEGGLIGKKFVVEIKIKTSAKGNDYITAASFSEAEAVSIDESFSLEEVSGVLIDKGVNSESQWLKPWDVVDQPVSNIQAQNAIPESNFIFPAFSSQPQGISTWDDVKEHGFKFRILNSKTAKYQKSIVYLPSVDKEDRPIDQTANIAWAKSQGYVPMKYDDLIDYIMASGYEKHFRFLNKWVNENVPTLIKAGKIPTQILNPKNIDLSIDENPKKEIPKVATSVVEDSVSSQATATIAGLPDIDLDDIADPFSN
jgi:hypothetical protein